MYSKFDLSIKKAGDLLYKIDYLFQMNNFASLKASNEFKKSCRTALTYRKLYDVATQLQDFNFMMKDKSFFQFSRLSPNGSVRYAYYPNPYEFIEYRNEKKSILELLAEELITQDEYDQLMTESEIVTDIPVIRYDLSYEQYSEKYHPAAHFHVSTFSENRWPVKRLLTPYAFFLKILKHYYIELWIEKGEALGSTENYLDKELRNELKGCELIDQKFFSKREEEHLYFS